jgi:hypothetical protein
MQSLRFLNLSYLYKEKLITLDQFLRAINDLNWRMNDEN